MTVELPQTIPALLARRASDRAQIEAIVGDEQRLTYAELDRHSAQRAGWLVANGVNKGHCVALQMPNGVEWAVNAYAILRIGAVLVPLSTLLRPPELAAQLTVGGVRHLIATRRYRTRDFYTEFESIDRAELPALRNVWWTDQLGARSNAQAQAVATALEQSVVPANDMVVIFTSGSTGEPKGVIHTHGNALRANAAGLSSRCVTADTRLYLPMPFFWVGGFAGGLVSALNAGATLLTEAAPEPAQTLRFLARERATLFRGWPDQAAQLASHPHFAATDLSALRAGSLDALLPPSLRSVSEQRANLFGMTETFGPYCGYRLDRVLPEGHWGSCGRPFDGMQLRIVNPESGAPLPAGEVGAIQLGGENILRGICGREREDVFTVDGWYDSGDLGRLDEDGFLYYAGRRDDMVKIKGTTVYPVEIQNALQAIPGIQRAFVTDFVVDGVAAIGAAVLPDNTDARSVAQLRQQARQCLSAFKVPSRWVILRSLAELPRNATGKLDKAGLQALLLSAE
jgi:acyl-CoA synthetase (AMP-forming)/AMP-acid ligase II